MTRAKVHYVGVAFDAKTLSVLRRRARQNGRPLGREAIQLIKAALSAELQPSQSQSKELLGTANPV